MSGWTLFDTPIGNCAVAWDSGRLVGVQLPEGEEAATRARLRRRFPGSEEKPPPPFVEEAILVIRDLLDGRPARKKVDLDWSRVSGFDTRVYEAACRIPAGRTMTYGELAELLGDRQLSRAVGQSLGRNPWPILIPCHRIIASGGGKGGFSAYGGADTKMRLLRFEGAFAEADLPLFGAAGGGPS